jgi:hypothetical protein
MNDISDTKKLHITDEIVVDEENMKQKYVNGGAVLTTSDAIHLLLLSHEIKKGLPVSIIRKTDLDIVLTPKTAKEIGYLLINEANKFQK